MKISFGWVGIGLGIAIAGAGLAAVRLRADRPIVVINGETISRGVFLAKLENEYGAPVLRKLMRERLVYQEAKKRNMLPSDAEVKAEIDKMREVEPDLERQLRLGGKTMNDLMVDVRGRMALANLITAKVKVPEADVKKFWNANQKQFNRPESRKIEMILAKDAPTAEKARRMMADGIPSEFAAQNPGMGLPGGRSQIVLSRGQLPPQFEKQIFNLKKGVVSPVLRMGKAHVVVKVLEELPAKKKSYEDVAKELAMGFKLRKGLSEAEFLQELQKTAKIDFKSDRYRGLADTALFAGDPRAARRAQARPPQKPG
jgi:parvulin-like peptidyl-prolyl isomerase